MELGAHHRRKYEMPASPRFCSSPVSRIPCHGCCRPGTEAVTPTAISLVACSDYQRTWEAYDSSLTKVVCNFLGEHLHTHVRTSCPHLTYDQISSLQNRTNDLRIRISCHTSSTCPSRYRFHCFINNTCACAVINSKRRRVIFTTGREARSKGSRRRTWERQSRRRRLGTTRRSNCRTVRRSRMLSRPTARWTTSRLLSYVDSTIVLTYNATDDGFVLWGLFYSLAVSFHWCVFSIFFFV